MWEADSQRGTVLHSCHSLLLPVWLSVTMKYHWFLFAGDETVRIIPPNGTWNEWATDVHRHAELLKLWKYVLTYLLLFTSYGIWGFSELSPSHVVLSSTSAHDMVTFWSSCTTVVHQLFLSRPGFLLPGGVRLKASLEIRSFLTLSHRKHLYLMFLVMLVFLYNCWLIILYIRPQVSSCLYWPHANLLNLEKLLFTSLSLF